jgi:hypothetical protein
LQAGHQMPGRKGVSRMTPETGNLPADLPQRAAGSSEGRLRTSLVSASIPPLEAPITTISRGAIRVFPTCFVCRH